MGMAGGVGILKFANYGILILLVLGIIAGVINGALEYKRTGDASMLIDKSLGEVVTWDHKIYVSMSQLLDIDFLNSIPEEIRGDYVSAIAKGVFINLFLLCLLIYGLFRFGSWLSGKSQLDPMTDLAVIGFYIISFWGFSIIIWLSYGCKSYYLQRYLYVIQ